MLVLMADDIFCKGVAQGTVFNASLMFMVESRFLVASLRELRHSNVVVSVS